MEFLYILFGCVLGIFSPLISKKIFEKYERGNLKKIVFAEMKDLKKRLAPITYLVLPKFGKLDKESFEWLQRNSTPEFLEIEKELSKSKISLQEVIDHLNKRETKENTLSYFKKVHLFAIDSHFINLNLLENELIEKVLEIRFQIEAFNEEIDSFRDLLRMTFMPGVEPSNHFIISQELKNKSLNIAKTSRYIVDKINKIL